MKKKYIYIAALGLVTIPAAAQDTYSNEKMIANDLNGTARYVAMGGAMEALGADISTISSNPAGIGLFKSSQIAISAGMVGQSGAKTSLDPFANGVGFSFNGNKTNASFDQAGFVLARRSGANSFLNLSFNFHKSKNFDQILSAAGLLDHASQNKLTSNKFNGNILIDGNTTTIDAAYGGAYNSKGQYVEGLYEYYDDKKVRHIDYSNGQEFRFGQYQKGYIGTYDFNISGNIHDRVFLGFSVGIHDVHYTSNSVYAETLENNTYGQAWESLRITGTGFDMKVGAIFRPIETSPFRFGVYINTPTFYNLSLAASSDIEGGEIGSDGIKRGSDARLDYKMNTPWKFGLSLGHTVGRYLALGFTYEYSDYSSMDNRIDDGGYYDLDYNIYSSTSVSDEVMNRNTDMVLKGLHTLKLGFEYKPISTIALRLGYNYVSPKFESDGFRDQTLDSQGVAYATSTDYTNWKSTNRITAGVGFTFDKLYLDMAYQYSQTNGDFYPFMNYSLNDRGEEGKNDVAPTSVSNKRNQLLVTLGYRF